MSQGNKVLEHLKTSSSSEQSQRKREVINGYRKIDGQIYSQRGKYNQTNSTLLA